MSWNIDDLFPHPFNEKYWVQGVTEETLISALEEYQNEFGLNEWSKDDVHNFLIINFHLVKGHAGTFHFRTILTIIQGGA